MTSKLQDDIALIINGERQEFNSSLDIHTIFIINDDGSVDRYILKIEKDFYGMGVEE